MSLDQFKFQPEKIETGLVLHYTKSNIDGSYPARIYIRVMDEDNLDVWKFEEHNEDAAHVTAHMNWEIFSADALHAGVMFKDGAEEPRATMSMSKADSSFSVQIGDMQESVKVGLFPAHVYNFDFISLIFSLKHWKNPEGEVEIGIIQPNFNPKRPGVIHYEGTVTIKFLSREARNGFDCRKYSIGGEGLQNTSGFIWMDAAAGQVVDIEIPIADNPDWDDFKFKLESTRKMNDSEWKEFIHSEIGKLND